MSGADLLDFSFHETSANPSLYAEKSPTALRTISEVSDLLDIPQHVLRFWETKFPQINPLKRAGGRRFYRPDDIEVLQQVKFLLYKQGYTIKGAKKAIEDYARVLASTHTDIGQLSVEDVVQPANINDNEATPNEVTPETVSDASALAYLRAELVEMRDALASRLGISLESNTLPA